MKTLLRLASYYIIVMAVLIVAIGCQPIDTQDVAPTGPAITFTIERGTP